MKIFPIAFLLFLTTLYFDLSVYRKRPRLRFLLSTVLVDCKRPRLRFLLSTILVDCKRPRLRFLLSTILVDCKRPRLHLNNSTRGRVESNNLSFPVPRGIKDPGTRHKTYHAIPNHDILIHGVFAKTFHPV